MIPEKRLTELFDTLPIMNIGGKDWQPRFDFGSEIDLNNFLNQKRKERSNPYPLVWLQTPFRSKELMGGNMELYNLNFVIGTLSSATKSNRERLYITFEPVLIPLLAHFRTALNESGFTQIINNAELDRTNYFNYGQDDESTFTDIWDAIQVNIDISMNHNCLQQINYNINTL